MRTTLFIGFATLLTATLATQPTQKEVTESFPTIPAEITVEANDKEIWECIKRIEHTQEKTEEVVLETAQEMQTTR